MIVIEDTDILKQIMDHCDEHQNYSYYELMLYVENKRPDWATVLRKREPRRCIAEYLRSMRRKCKAGGIKQPTLYESVQKYLNKM